MKDEESPDENVEAIPMAAQADSTSKSVSDESTVWDRARRIDEELFFGNFERPADETPRKEIRGMISDYVLNCPGQTLTEIAEEFRERGYSSVSTEVVRAALKHDDAIDSRGLLPIALKTWRNKRFIYGWRYPRGATDMSNYIEACLSSTKGDLVNIHRAIIATQVIWGKDAVEPAENAELMERMYAAADLGWWS